LSPDAVTKVVFLGTNGWYTTKTGNTTCLLVDAPECYLILDAGNGMKDVDGYITDKEKPIFLFLSHFHLDHVEGLHILNKFRFPQGLTICCYRGGKEVLNRFVTQPFTVPFGDLSYRVDFKELDPGRSNGFPFGLECAELDHSARCFGYRFEFKDKTITYCTDTGYCEAAVNLSKGADLVITECAWRNEQENVDWPHLDPKSAGRLAKEAGVKQLAMMHFDAENYPDLADRKEAEDKARKIFANTKATRDGMAIEL